MKQAMQKRTVLFILITYGISWAIGLFAMACGVTLDGLMGAQTLSAGWLPAMAALGVYMWVPTLGALATRLLTGQGLRGWQLKPRLRAAWKEHLTGWFAPFLFTLVGAGTYFLIFRGRFDRFAALKGMLRQAAGTTFLDAMTPPALAALLLFSAAAAVPLVSICRGPLGEELGWRGYLYPVLCAWMPRRQAMLVSGVVWGVWHAPLLIMGWDYGTSYPGYPVCGIAVMTLCTVCLGAFQCWLVDRAGSIWPAVLAHGAVNTLFSLYLLGGNFCAEPFNPLLGAHPLTLLGGWPLLAAGCAAMADGRRRGGR